MRYHGSLPEIDFKCAFCGSLVERSYADRYQRSNKKVCGECRVKKVRDHDWFRDEILARGEATCGICQEPIDLSLKYPDPRALSIDHIIPLVWGGTNNRHNLQPSCLICNFRKRDRIAPPIAGALTLF
ncbi:HNH endonuclease [Corynebacterium sp. YIM 101645]|uniref:HNH endonuclease n=1 Tax=Corynebacterium lemuris TaxID=1859292 RepID=A0ABT2FZE5_9CORY|nr:HNH endonuclease [Corynebacterium lemuris]